MKLLRLIVLLLCGALVGFAFLGFELLAYFHGYDHGFGQGQRCTLAGTVIGALTGLAIECLWRRKENNNWRYTTRDLLVLMTMGAIIVALLVWARSTGWPP